MPVESLICPHCGAPVRSVTAATISCPYCGAALQVTGRTSGTVVAVDGGGIVAKRAALAHLRERQGQLQAEHEALKRHIQIYQARKRTELGYTSAPVNNSTAYALLGVAGFFLLSAIIIVAQGGSDSFGGALVLAIGFGAWGFSKLRKSQRARSIRRYLSTTAIDEAVAGQPRTFQQIQDELADVEARIAGLTSELDQLAKEA